jgi:hypothetical protein
MLMANGKTVGLVVAGLAVVSGIIVAVVVSESSKNKTPAGVTLSSIAITVPSGLTQLVNTTQQFKAIGTYSDGSTKNITSQVTWTSSKTNIATVSASGLVTAIAAGNTSIMATLSGINSTVVPLTIIPATGGGAASFSVSVVNLPAEAVGFDCSFQDPTTGIWYAPTNGWVPGDPIPAGDIISFAPTAQAQFSVPVSSGILSIFAPGGSGNQTGGQISLPPVLASYKINVSVVDGGAYTFDFDTQSFKED